ncbi:MAG: HEAT repeat domain-containing protein [Planctomycetota bacterium]
MKLRWMASLGLVLAVWGLTPVRAQAEEIASDSVIKMLDAKVSESTITQIFAMPGNTCHFDMTTETIIKLKQAGASDNLISKMIEISSEGARDLESDVLKFLNNALNSDQDTTPEEAEIFRQSRQKVISYGQKVIPEVLKQGLQHDLSARAQEAALGVIYELLTPEYNDPTLTEQLKQRLLSDDTNVRYAAARAFSVIATQADIDKCFDTIINAHPVYSDGYVMVLAFSRNGNSIPKLEGLMENSDPEVRRVAAFGIGYQHVVQKKTPSADTLKLLISHMLDNPNETTEVRIACTKAIADMGVYNDDTLNEVINAAEKYPAAKPSMVLMMANFTRNNYLILDYLVNTALADTDDPRVVDAANSALRKLTKRNDNTIEEWRNWWRVQKAILDKVRAAQGNGSATPAVSEGTDTQPAPTTTQPATPPPETGHPAGGTTTANATPPAPETGPPETAPVQKATDAQEKAVMQQLVQVSDLIKSVKPEDWGTIVGHYQAILKVLLPLGEKHNWNIQFHKDLLFAQTYQQGLEQMDAKNYTAARKSFETCKSIGFHLTFDGVDKRLAELDKLAAGQPVTPAPAHD